MKCPVVRPPISVAGLKHQIAFLFSRPPRPVFYCYGIGAVMRFMYPNSHQLASVGPARPSRPRLGHMSASSPIEIREALCASAQSMSHSLFFSFHCNLPIWALHPDFPSSGRHLEPNKESQVVAHKDGREGAWQSSICESRNPRSVKIGYFSA